MPRDTRRNGHRKCRFFGGIQQESGIQLQATPKRDTQGSCIFLAKTDSQRVILSNEHIAYSWTDFDSALAKLTYMTAKDILVKAQDYLKSRYIK